MLQIENLQFQYQQKPILQGLSLSLPPGIIMGILGRNGAGKTSLFKLISGWLKPQQGQIQQSGQPLPSHQVAFLETHPYFYPFMTGKEYLQLLRLQNPDFSIDQWNHIFQLPLNDYATTYSTGMKKQLAILGILALDRPIVILDEPFNGLDFESTEKLYRIILRLQEQNKTVLISSHIIESLTSICRKVAYLQNGQIQQIFEQAKFNEMEKLLRSSIQKEMDIQLDELLKKS